MRETTLKTSPDENALLALAGGDGPQAVLRWLRRYAMAAAAVLLASYFRWLLVGVLGYDGPYLTVFPAVMLVTLMLGPGPGLLGGLVGMAVTETWLVDPVGRWADDPRAMLRGAIMVAGSVVAGSFGWHLRRTRSDALAALDHFNDAFVVVDRHWRVTFANRLAVSMSQPTQSAALQNQTFWQAWPMFSDAGTRRSLEDAAAWRQAVRLEHHESAAKRWHMISFSPRDRQMTLVITDISESKQFSEALRDNQERFSMAQEAAHIGVFDWNVVSGELVWTPELVRLFGIAPGAFENHIDGWTSRVVPDDLQRLQADFAQWARQRQSNATFEYRFIRDCDGATRWMVAQTRLFYDDIGRLVRMLGTNMDVTEHRQDRQLLQELNTTLEQQVTARTTEAETKAEQLRMLAAELTLTEERERQRVATVLHDELAQPLAMCRTRLSVLEKQIADTACVALMHEADAALGGAIRQTRELMEDLSPPMLHDLGLVAALEGLAERLCQRSSMHVRVQSAYQRLRLHSVPRSIAYLIVEQLLVAGKMLNNCREATVRIDGDDPDYINLTVGFSCQLADGQAAWHAHFHGRPQLLSLKERLELLGGHVQFQPGGEGNCGVARLRVPRMRSDPIEDERRPHAAGLVDPDTVDSVTRYLDRPAPQDEDGAAVRVLLVDDHKIVRDGLAGLLQGQPGIEVVAEAADGVEAIEQARRHRPDVVVMDISMPRMNGIEATRAIVAEQPAVKVIGLSMHEEEDLSNRIREAGAVSYLSKGGPICRLIEEIRTHGARAAAPTADSQVRTPAPSPHERQLG